MFELLLTSLSLVSIVLSACLIMLLYKFKENVPELLQGALNDVGTQLSGIFKEPMVKRGMSIIAKEGGVVRADKALKNRVAEKALGSNVVVKKVLEYFGLSALEGIELMQDPTFGPIIQGFIAKGGQGLLSGFNSPNSSRPGQRGRGVPLMS